MLGLPYSPIHTRFPFGRFFLGDNCDSIKFRDSESLGFISLAKCLKLGITISVFAAIIFGFWKVLFVNYINTDYSELAFIKQEQLFLQLDQEMPSLFGDIDEKLDKLEENKNVSPLDIMIAEIIYKCIGGGFLSFLLSFFLKKENPNLIQ